MHAQFITQLGHKSSASQGAVTHRLSSVSVRETENSSSNYCSCRLHFKINLTFKRNNSQAWQIAAVGLQLVGVFKTATSGVSLQRQVRKEMCFCRILEVLSSEKQVIVKQMQVDSKGWWENTECMICMIDINHWGTSQDALTPLISSCLVLLWVNDDKIYFDYYQCFRDFVSVYLHICPSYKHPPIIPFNPTKPTPMSTFLFFEKKRCILRIKFKTENLKRTKQAEWVHLNLVIHWSNSFFSNLEGN